jgi:hypothetical protein
VFLDKSYIDRVRNQRDFSHKLDNYGGILDPKNLSRKINAWVKSVVVPP